MLNKTETRPYEELSEYLFGEGNCFNESEVRKRMYGMKRLIEIIEQDKYSDVETRILAISDLHIPFHLPLETFKDYIGVVDVLILNGDILDCTQLSRFSKSYRVNPVEEMIIARQYIIDLIDMIKPKKVIVNHGNHEMRLGATLSKNLDNELQELMPETAFDYIFNDGFIHYNRRTKSKTKYEALKDVFTDVEIVYTGTWHTQVGDVVFCHPRAFSSGILKTAEKAMYWFRNEGYSFSGLVMSHTHRLGQYKIGNSMIYEQGTCCDTRKMLYNDGNLVNSQKEGFMYICLGYDGKVIDDKTKLVSLN